MKAAFDTGERVKVRQTNPPGHVRTPFYIRGKTGEIERVCDEFGNPEELAFGRRDGAPLRLYRVRFSLDDVWSDYRGPGSDTIDVELYEHWLEPAEEAAA